MLIDAGWTERRIAAAVEQGSLLRVRRGWYVDAGWARDVWPESLHLLHLLAVANDARGAELIFANVSAAVLWQLPLYRIRPRRVHVLHEPGQRHSIPDLFRHEGELGASDIAVRHGLLCTSLDRTVRDLARTVPVEAGIAAADAALASVARSRRDYRPHEADAWKSMMLDALAAPARGVRQARSVIEAADGRAESPGESVSRIHLVRAGFGRVEPQVPVPAPGGRRYFVDLGLEDVRAFGEFDGEGKYLDEAQRSGRTIEAVYLEEKQREDWIRGTTQRRFARWGPRELASPETLASHLASFGIRPGRR